MKIESCDILMVKNRGWISRLIRIITRGHYDHCAVFVNEYEIVEAIPAGVKLNNIQKYKDVELKGNSKYDIYRFPGLLLEKKEKIVEFLRKEIGTKYDEKQFIILWLRYIFHISRKKPIERKQDKKWICSELLGEAFFSAGIRISDRVSPDTLVPADIARNKDIIKLSFKGEK